MLLGMAAIITSTSFQAATGLTVTGADLTALAAVCASVDTAIRRLIYPFQLEPVTITDHVCDAPNNEVLILPLLPVRSITSIYLNYSANGLATNFTSDNLLDNSEGAEYWLHIDRPTDSYSRSGKVFRRGGSWGWFGGGGGVWGAEGFAATRNALAGSVRAARGAIKVTYAAGTLSIPDDVFEAAKLAVAMLYGRRTTGIPVTNESWNGYSYGTSGPFTAVGALHTPDIQSLLAYYLPGVHVARD